MIKFKINRKKLLYSGIGFLLVFIFIIGIINYYVLSFYKGSLYSDVSELNKSKVGIVLGASVLNDKTPSNILKDRLDIAFEAYSNGKIQKLILSGDNSIDYYNEPVTMQKYLMEAGVKEEDLYLDYAGFDTYDSLYRARDIFQVDSLVVFSQDYHLKRAIYIGNNLGLNTSGVSTSRDIYKKFYQFPVREVFARVKAFLEVELLKPKPKFLGEKITIYYKTQKELDTEKLLSNIDLNTDSSFTKFVNNRVSFNDLKYIPEDLVSIKGEYVVDLKGYGTLRNEASEALRAMSIAFNKEFNKSIYVVSSYRSYLYQKGIKDRGCPDNLCAKAGYSEHQTGLTIDLWETTTNKQFLSNSNYRKYFEWLNINAHRYGFHNTYQKGLNIDGYEIEPWHWRYTGELFATYLKENNQTIAEFYTTFKK